MTTRINLYGGPGCGKSTAAHYLMWRFKTEGVHVELAREWVKRLTSNPPGERRYLQLQAVVGQFTEEMEAIRSADVVISESPLLQQAAYADRNILHQRRMSLDVAFFVEQRYPGKHIFLMRGGIPYVQEGRWETEQAAQSLDNEIHRLLQRSELDYQVVPATDYENLWRVVNE